MTLQEEGEIILMVTLIKFVFQGT